MAVFTPLSLEELGPWLSRYDLGAPLALQGIASGIENSNFFLSTERGGVRHEYVLTIFEKLSAAELPFYLDLTAHLSTAGIPCPGPERARDGSHFHLLKGKPAAIVRRLPGSSLTRPGNAERAEVGAMLARMHLAGQTFTGFQHNPRGQQWRAATVPSVLPFLPSAVGALLQDEMAFQGAHAPDKLPRGPIHADLFRDNVLFDGAGAGTYKLGGFIDFYFAGCDSLLFDVAVCVNDWCIVHAGDVDSETGSAAAQAGALVPEQVSAFLSAYHAVRPFTAAEQAAWSVMLRAAALRFWLSRLFDFYLPRKGEMITPHDPTHFERILRQRRSATSLPWI